jgi:putative ABC transport system permease protein
MTSLLLALRRLRQSPGFTAVVILTLALGVGANTAVFSVLNAVLLRPGPFPHEEELVFMGEWSEQVPNMSVAYPNFLDWRERQHSFTSLGIFRGQSYNYIGPAETERVAGNMISHDLLPTLGVPPLFGRFFTTDEDNPGAERTVLISERFWRRVFEARSDVVGEKLTLSGEVYTVVGVMPAKFEFSTAATDVWTPVGLMGANPNFTNRGNHPGLYAIARLKPGVTLEAARADMVAIAAQLAETYPDQSRGNSVSMQMVLDFTLGAVRPALWVLFGAAGFVLLIACANVANLMLARAAARTREFAVRAALGAGRAQIVRQLLLESVLLGLLGSAAGLLVAGWCIGAMKGLLPSQLPGLARIGLDPWALGFGLGVGTLTAIAFGLVPALAASRVNLLDALSQSGRTAGAGHGNRGRVALIVGEFALTVVLLSGAGLMMRTLHKLYTADPGFRTERLLSFGWVIQGPTFSDAGARIQVTERALERLAALPGVTTVGLVNPLPLSGGGNQSGFRVEGTEDPGPGRLPSTEVGTINPDYFTTMRIPLLAGRPFTTGDRADSAPVTIIDTTLAERFFPGESPLGRRIRFGGTDNPWMEIVGVVGHIQNYGIGQTTRFQLYRPFTQGPASGPSFVLRTSMDPAALAPAVRQAMREVDPTLPIFNVRTMDEVFDRTVATQRLALALLGVFAGLALLLAGVGLYGVLSYAVGRRTREFGVRLAIGATPRALLGHVLAGGFKLAAIGLGIGLGGALVLARLMRGMLYEVPPHDPLTLAAVAALLLAVGLLACWLPARRATRVNPIEALRAE